MKSSCDSFQSAIPLQETTKADERRAARIEELREELNRA